MHSPRLYLSPPSFLYFKPLSIYGASSSDDLSSGSGAGSAHDPVSWAICLVVIDCNASIRLVSALGRCSVSLVWLVTPSCPSSCMAHAQSEASCATSRASMAVARLSWGFQILRFRSLWVSGFQVLRFPGVPGQATALKKVDSKIQGVKI